MQIADHQQTLNLLANALLALHQFDTRSDEMHYNSAVKYKKSIS